jgi:hypothetical protein
LARASVRGAVCPFGLGLNGLLFGLGLELGQGICLLCLGGLQVFGQGVPFEEQFVPFGLGLTGCCSAWVLSWARAFACCVLGGLQVFGQGVPFEEQFVPFGLGLTGLLFGLGLELGQGICLLCLGGLQVFGQGSVRGAVCPVRPGPDRPAVRPGLELGQGICLLCLGGLSGLWPGPFPLRSVCPVRPWPDGLLFGLGLELGQGICLLCLGGLQVFGQGSRSRSSLSRSALPDRRVGLLIEIVGIKAVSSEQAKQLMNFVFRGISSLEAKQAVKGEVLIGTYPEDGQSMFMNKFEGRVGRCVVPGRI